MCVDESIIVIGQAQHCHNFSTDTRCVLLAKPLPFQVFPSNSLATNTPLARGSRLGSHCWWMVRRESRPLCRVICHHQIIVENSCSANRHALNLFEVLPAIVQIVGCTPQVAIRATTGVLVQPQETTSSLRRPPLPSKQSFQRMLVFCRIACTIMTLAIHPPAQRSLLCIATLSTRVDLVVCRQPIVQGRKLVIPSGFHNVPSPTWKSLQLSHAISCQT